MKKLSAIFMIFVLTIPNSYCVQAAENTMPVVTYESDTAEETGTMISISNIEIEGYVNKFDEKSGDYIFEPIEEIKIMAIEDFYSINPENIDFEARSRGEYVVEECSFDPSDIEEADAVATAASSLPDLTVTSLNATTDLLTGQTSKFSYKVSNLGGSIAKDVEVAFIVDDGLAGTFKLGDIEAGKTANAHFELGVIDEKHKGKHGVGVYADYNNKIEESNETNNFYGKYFIWYNEKEYNPDLTVEILSPTDGEIWGARDSDDTQTVKFRIYNEGPKPTSQEFYLYVYIDGTRFARMRVSEIPAFTGIPGSFEMGITGYKPFELEMEIDALNDIAEANENNNSDKRSYIPQYCIHRAKVVDWLPKPGENLSVKIRKNGLFGYFTQAFYQENLSAWNGITDKCSIRQATISDDTAHDMQILILENPQYIPKNPAGTYTYVDRNDKDIKYNIIELNQEYIANNHFNQAECIRTFIHELGHAFTLGHPNEDILPGSGRDTCEYSSIMFQSNMLGSDGTKDHTKISAHDKYSLYKRYNGGIGTADAKAYSADDFMSIYHCRVQEITSADVLSSESDCIVRGRVLPNSENILTEFSGYTRTAFVIDEVYKGDTLKINDVIQLQEPYHTEIYSDGSTKFVCYDDYMPSEVGKDYILFITKWDGEELYYLPYTTLSRYAVEDEVVEFPNSDNPDYTVENYNALKKQVLETYN